MDVVSMSQPNIRLRVDQQASPCCIFVTEAGSLVGCLGQQEEIVNIDIDGNNRWATAHARARMTGYRSLLGDLDVGRGRRRCGSHCLRPVY